MSENKVVAITGGAGGIGTALARAFGRNGADIVLLDRDKNALDKAIDGLTGVVPSVRPVQCDVTDINANRNAIEVIENG